MTNHAFFGYQNEKCALCSHPFSDRIHKRQSDKCLAHPCVRAAVDGLAYCLQHAVEEAYAVWANSTANNKEAVALKFKTRDGVWMRLQVD